MRDPPSLHYDPHPGPDLVRLVEEHVNTAAMHALGALDHSPANFFLKSARGEWVGGCLGMVWANWLHVRYLWVAERLRGQGQGARLLAAAEDHARALGAGHATLDTLNPAALGFYRRQGYEVFGTLEDYPPGFARYYLRKRLGAAG